MIVGNFFTLHLTTTEIIVFHCAFKQARTVYLKYFLFVRLFIRTRLRRLFYFYFFDKTGKLFVHCLPPFYRCYFSLHNLRGRPGIVISDFNRFQEQSTDLPGTQHETRKPCLNVVIPFRVETFPTNQAMNKFLFLFIQFLPFRLRSFYFSLRDSSKKKRFCFVRGA